MQAVAAAEPHAARCWFAALPHSLLVNILARLLPRARARCATVCRAFRDALEDPAAWAVLDTSRGERPFRDDKGFTAEALRAAAARARGALRVLDLNDLSVPDDAVLGVLTSNAAALREVFLCGSTQYEHEVAVMSTFVHEVLDAAPALQTLAANYQVQCTYEEARAMLRREAPYAPLSMRGLRVSRTGAVDNREVDEDTSDDIVALAADLAIHGGAHQLVALELFSMLVEPAALDALADTVCALPSVTEIKFAECVVLTECIPAMARLVRAPGLTRLFIWDVAGDEPGFLGDSLVVVPQLAAALQTSSLTHLELCRVYLWRNFASASSLICALIGHPHLKALDLSDNSAADAEVPQAVIGALLGGLISARRGALEELRASDSDLNDDALAVLFRALPHAPRLRSLWLVGNDMSDECITECLMPALRENTGLRDLQLFSSYEPEPSAAMDEAEQVVFDRTPAEDR